MNIQTDFKPTMAGFTNVASLIGLHKDDIQFLMNTDDIHSSSVLNDDRYVTARKIISLHTLLGQGWLNKDNRFDVQDARGSTPREIIRESKDGLNNFCSAVEGAAGGPLI